MSKYRISAAPNSGFVLPHHSFFYFFNDHHPRGITISFSKAMNGEKHWQQLYRFPYFGYGFHFSDLGNSTYFGNAFAVFGFINIPVFRGEKRTEFSYTIGSGYSFLTKHFDTDLNYYNLAIGSAGNVYFNLGLDFKCRLTGSLIWETGTGITHFSNGAFSKPNTGINVMTAHTGMIYTLGQTDIVKNNLTAKEVKNSYSLIYSAGIREITPPTGKKYFISSLSASVERSYWRKRRLGLGLDIFYDNSLIPRLEQQNKMNNTEFDNTRCGIHFSHDLIFGKTAITMQIGSYLYTKYQKDGYLYKRFGIKQRFNDHWMVNICLKTHYFKADFIEWGVGYYFE
ncbi:MAG: acyloxyacyl hydrolase [Bacteroidota bacterium]